MATEKTAASMAAHRPRPQAGMKPTNVITFPHRFVLTEADVKLLVNHMASKQRQ